VSTRGELEEVEGGDGRGLDTGNVAESLGDTGGALIGGVEDDKRTTALAVTASTQLTLTGTGLAGLRHLDDIGVGTDGLEEGNSGAGLGEVVEGGGGDDKGKLGDFGDAVTTGLNQGNGSGGSKGRGSSETSLSLGDLHMPLAPGLGGREHTTGTTLVTEGSLTGTVGSSTRDTGDTGNSTTCSIVRQLDYSIDFPSCRKSSPVPQDSAEV